MSIQLDAGIYEHYKGKRYQVIGVGKDAETEVDVVIYYPLYNNDIAYWVRPYEIFVEKVDVNGEVRPRFEKVNE